MNINGHLHLRMSLHLDGHLLDLISVILYFKNKLRFDVDYGRSSAIATYHTHMVRI